MLAILSVLVVVTLSILVTRVATIALIHTGLSRDAARFQARSAFTGVGFTTGEAESITDHPVRRRIVMLLMLLGNAGIITVIGSLVLGFVDEGGGPGRWVKMGALLGGLALLWVLAMSRYVDRWLSRVIDGALRRWTDLDVRDYAALLHVSGDFGVEEAGVEADDWMAGRTLRDLQLRAEGIHVIGIERSDGSYVGVPHGETTIEPGDRLILYGREPALRRLDRRKGAGGEAAHEEAVAEHRTVLREQEDAEDRRRTG